MVVPPFSTTETSVDGVERLVNEDESVDDGTSVSWRDGEVSVGDGEVERSIVRRDVEVEGLSELRSDLVESLIRPVAEPVEDASIEESLRDEGGDQRGKEKDWERERDRARTGEVAAREASPFAGGFI